MTFSDSFSEQTVRDLVNLSGECDPIAVQRVLRKGRADSIEEFAALISPAATSGLEPMVKISQQLTQFHFGKVIRLFAPLYLSNECVNICKYCGFSRNNKIPRVTIPISQVVEETRKLANQGMRNLLLVAGEHPKYVSNGYVKECIERCLPMMPSISLELGPMETETYIPLVKAGCEGLVVFQETYDSETYKQMHVAGPKKHFKWRMDTPERAYEAGFRRLGLGALFGMADWRYEAIALAMHAYHLTRRCWKAQVSLCFPRMRPAVGGFQLDPQYQLPDREFVQLIAAMRMLLPHAAFVLSTRETPTFRDGIMTLGITQMSAGASTEPGGYSAFDETQWVRKSDQPGEQFHIADERNPAQVAAAIRSKGYDPVWKDFDQSLVA
jgi:2-iminoacetate synthase